MLTVSAGIINTDIDIAFDGDEYYLYRELLIRRGSWVNWSDRGEDASGFRRGGNKDLTFIKRKEVSLGLSGSLLNRLITFNANYFYNTMDGGVIQPTNSFPSYFLQTGYPNSSLLPIMNYDIDGRQGVDFSVYFNQKVDDFSFTLGASGMYQTGNAIKRDENFQFDYQTRVGRSLNQIWGLVSDGFFTEADINNPATPWQSWGNVQPGDIKYKDQNNDNIIDSNDEVYLGSWNNTMTLGINLTLKWKSFTLFTMGTGFFGGHGMKNSDYYWSGRSDRKYSEVVRDRWTPALQNTATYPRLTTTNGDNNFRNSDFWLYKTDRFYLSMVQITYDIPTTLLGEAVKDLSVYVGGYSLLTISKERKHMEMNVGGPPQIRFYNFGVKATF